METEAPAIPRVTPAAVGAVVGRIEDSGRHPSGGVIGIRAVPDETVTLSSLSAAGHAIEVAACPSTLAVWDAIYSWEGEGWLVILTDRPEEDLGSGTLARFVEHRLLTPDPWEAAMQVFGARTIQRALLAEGKYADLPTQLVAITPFDGWPAAPGGVLTREHVYASVAVKYLGLPLGADGPGILEWTTRDRAISKVSQLRTTAQDALTDAVLGWLADQFGPARKPVLHLLQRGRLAEILPTGLALHLLRAAEIDLTQEAKISEARLSERTWPGLNLTDEELEGLGALCHTTVEELLARTVSRGVGERVLEQTDELLFEVSASAVARRSGLLPSSLDAAYVDLGAAFEHLSDDIEQLWNQIEHHPLSTNILARHYGRRKSAAHAGVRIYRWLNQQHQRSPDARLTDHARLQSADDAWADAAINIAATGADTQQLATGLSSVVSKALERRQEHGRAFGRALATEGTSTTGQLTGAQSPDGWVWRIEDLAEEVIAPIVRESPTLVILIDGMSTGTATQVLDSVTGGPGKWTEMVPTGSQRRASALAVLPTLTEHSRTSFFCGKVTSGGQSHERTGFDQIGRLAGYEHSTLFHKGVLGSSRHGFELADDVANALENTDKHRLVGCVLNTIDDALDRSDPSGTVWDQQLVQHLGPLLDAARKFGRTVIITADHGHVVERHSDLQRTEDASSARSRGHQDSVAAGEVLVSGPRVLAHEGNAVLAVDENLRYTSKKAGYHGGGSSAETVVPVAVLVPTQLVKDEQSPLDGWTQAPTQMPTWWELASTGARHFDGAVEPENQALGQHTFDVFSEPSSPGVGASVVESTVYKNQYKIAGRVSLEDERVAELLDALLAEGKRIGAPAVAALLRIPEQIGRAHV